MLNLFKISDENISPAISNQRIKELLTSYLNKGVIPTWAEFFQYLPSQENEGDLDQIKDYFSSLTKWPFLEEILAKGGTEFFFHSQDKIQRLTLEGEKILESISLAPEDWQLWLEIISIHFRQNWNVRQPFVSFYVNLFGREYRLSLIHGSTSPHGISKLVLRSLSPQCFKLESFGHVAQLASFVKQKKNILIGGSTGSGKTSLLSSLLGEAGDDEHILVLEDTQEIVCSKPFLTRFLAGDSPETSLKNYLTYSLRLSPERIILGEMRSHEAVPFLLAMNTGHRGLMGTVHASSAVDCLYRVCLLFTLYAGEAGLSYECVMELICRNLEYVVFMENKKVKEVIKVLGSEKGTPFFETVTGFQERCELISLF
jgi:type IV secretory pathway ATPase VirB11/archaellum biosynthesis ATPase